MKKEIWMTRIIALAVLLQTLPSAEAYQRVERVKAVVVTILSDRFDPPSAIVSDRKIMLVVYNGDALEAHEFSFDRLGPSDAFAGQLRREQIPQFATKSVNVFDLQPGRYRLTEIRSGRTFHLTVR